jgi:hypothetical protein
VLLCGKAGARPLLLFHGTSNNSLMWRYNGEQLGERFHLHLVDTVNDPDPAFPVSRSGSSRMPDTPFKERNRRS